MAKTKKFEVGDRVTGTWADAKGQTFLVVSVWRNPKFVTLVSEQTGERKPAGVGMLRAVRARNARLA